MRSFTTSRAVRYTYFASHTELVAKYRVISYCVVVFLGGNNDKLYPTEFFFSLFIVFFFFIIVTCYFILVQAFTADDFNVINKEIMFVL